MAAIMMRRVALGLAAIRLRASPSLAQTPTTPTSQGPSKPWFVCLFIFFYIYLNYDFYVCVISSLSLSLLK